MSFERLVQWYLSRFPIEKGKWPLWVMLQPHLRQPASLNVERTIKYGIQMKLCLAEYVDRFIYYWDCFEPNETWAVQQLLRPGDTFVDVGANVGYFTLLASKIVGRNGKVISFEPAPSNASRLRENVRLNQAENVITYEFAVSDRPGTVRIGRQREGGSATFTIRIKESTAESWEVSAVQLDRILDSQQNIRLIKIDTEGAELLALKGFVEHLRSGNVPYVFCEIADSPFRELGGSTEELYSLMSSFGYSAYACNKRRFTPLNLDDVSKIDELKVLFSRDSLS